MSGKRNNGVMDKIESLIDRMDYKSVNIVIVTRKKTLTLEKERETKVKGFR